MGRKVMYIGEYSISVIGANELHQAIEFVIKTNYKIHNFVANEEDLESDVRTIYESERKIFEKSFFYNITDSENRIVGTLRVLIGKQHELDFMNNVGINVAGDICHIGRLAIDQHGDNKMGAKLFKHLILIAFSHVCQCVDNVLVAECDMKLAHVLQKMNIGIVEIGVPFMCLGSETVQVYAPYQNIIEYYTKNKLLQQIYKY